MKKQYKIEVTCEECNMTISKNATFKEYNIQEGYSWCPLCQKHTNKSTFMASTFRNVMRDN